MIRRVVWLFLTSRYQKIRMPSSVNTTLIELRWRRLKFLFSPFYTYISRRLRTTLYHFQRLIFQKPYDVYPNPNAEQQYWDRAERGLRQLRQSDARFVGSERPKNVRVPEIPPLVLYYVPALLPQYRDDKMKTKGKSRRRSVSLLGLEPFSGIGQ